MKLTDLNPGWVGAFGIRFDCPKGGPKCECGGLVFIPFENPLAGEEAAGRGPRWKQTGEDFETLTIHPSIHTHYPLVTTSHWHGWVRDGEITSA